MEVYSIINTITYLDMPSDMSMSTINSKTNNYG